MANGRNDDEFMELNQNQSASGTVHHTFSKEGQI